MSSSSRPPLQRVLRASHRPRTIGGDGAAMETESAGRESRRVRPPGRQLRLAVVDGPNVGWMLELRKSRVIVGRGRADLRLQDPKVCHLHCVLQISGDEVHLRDLPGTSGTWVNGERITRASLRNMDEIQIGSTVLLFTALPVADQPSPEPRAGAAEIGDEGASAASGAEGPMGGDGTARSGGESGESTAPWTSGSAVPAAPGKVPDGSLYQAKLYGVRGDMSIFLEIFSGPGAGSIFDLSRPGMYVIGRRIGAIPLEDDKCSRRHAKVEILSEGEYYLYDLASTSGTYLNEVRVSQRSLKHMDIIRVGGTQLRFSCAEKMSTAPPA